MESAIQLMIVFTQTMKQVHYSNTYDMVVIKEKNEFFTTAALAI